MFSNTACVFFAARSGFQFVFYVNYFARTSVIVQYVLGPTNCFWVQSLGLTRVICFFVMRRNLRNLSVKFA